MNSSERFLPFVGDRKHCGVATVLQDGNAPGQRAGVVQSWKQTNENSLLTSQTKPRPQRCRKSVDATRESY